MRYSIRINTLAAVIGVTLASATWHTPLQAGQVMSASSVPVAATVVQGAGVEPYIIEFVEPGLVNYNGGSVGLAATSPSATHSRKLDSTSAAAVAYGDFLEAQRATYVSGIQHAIARDLDVTHSYSVTLNGIAAEMSAAEALAAAQVPGVKSIRPAGVEYLDTYRGPTYIGASTIWDGSGVPGGVGNKGQGMTVGIIDGGANATHPSFANDATCGFSPANPKLKAVDCSSSSAGVCNGSNPDAGTISGHGVHTASTVAGNSIDNTVTPAPSLPVGVKMSGVAPCAQVFQYKACPGTTCPGADIVAGIDNAIRDGVDVINFSVSGGTSPWSDNDRKFLDAVNANIFVAASAGNNSSADPTVIGRVNHRGPWVMTVAASTQDEIIGPSLSVVGPGTPPVETTKISLNPGSTTTSTPTLMGKPIKSHSNVGACTADGVIPAGYFAGSIAVVKRGVCPFTEKITNAFAAGATAVLVSNNAVGSINMDTTGAPAVPAYSISMASGDALLAFIGANPTTATANLVPIGQAGTRGDVIGDFSYRGPTPGTLADLTKPDITAPGVNIYAATSPSAGQYEFMSGTSMSGPHVAGAATLMRAVHPDWTVPEVKSALQSTARPAGLMEDEVTPWTIDVVGSGVVDLSKAAKAGLTLDETYARFLASNPSGGSINVKDLNLAAVRNLACTPDCTFTRTVKNRLATSGTWSSSIQSANGLRAMVTPATFTLAPGATQVLTIKVGPPADTAMTQIGFGYLSFTEASNASPVQRFSVALKGTGGPAWEKPPVDDVIFADGFDVGGGGGGGDPVTMVNDDGSAENSVIWTDDDDLQQPSIWLNRFSPTAAQLPMTLENVQIFWRTLDTSGLMGKQVRVLVYVDADGDGDPSNAVLAGQSTVTISSMDVFQAYPVNVTLTAGDVYIGFEDIFAEGGVTPLLHAAAIDEDTTTNRAWVSANDVGSPDYTNLSANDYLDTIEALSGSQISGNWMIRGNGTTTAGQPVVLE